MHGLVLQRVAHTFTANPPSTSASFTSFEGTGYSGGLQYTALQHSPRKGLYNVMHT